MGLKVLAEFSRKPALCQSAFLLGHREYYPRFGFEPASTYHLVSQRGGMPDASYMVAVLDPGALPDKGGTARYRDEFDDAM